MKKSLKYKIYTAAVVIICIIGSFFFDNDKPNVPDNPDLCGPYCVERVVDGDTIIADVEGKRIRIRMIGIDTPESVAPEETGKTNTQEGFDASKRTKELLSDMYVYLEYDEEKYDQYDRVLAYVYFDEETTVEEVLLSEGLAKTMFYKPNYKYKSYFTELQKQAKQNKKGYWGTGFFK